LRKHRKRGKAPAGEGEKEELKPRLLMLLKKRPLEIYKARCPKEGLKSYTGLRAGGGTRLLKKGRQGMEYTIPYEKFDEKVKRKKKRLRRQKASGCTNLRTERPEGHRENPLRRKLKEGETPSKGRREQ